MAEHGGHQCNALLFEFTKTAEPPSIRFSGISKCSTAMRPSHSRSIPAALRAREAGSWTRGRGSRPAAHHRPRSAANGRLQVQLKLPTKSEIPCMTQTFTVNDRSSMAGIDAGDWVKFTTCRVDGETC
jgi:hypothetical protein